MTLPFQSQRVVTTDQSKRLGSILATTAPKTRAVIIIPPFSQDVPIWLGASFITLEFRGNIDQNFSILPGWLAPPNPNFCLAVRSVYDYNSNLDYKIQRKKLISNVGESLNYDDYNGETICKSFALEIWTTDNQGTTSLDTPITLQTSILVNNTDCCGASPLVEPIYQVCELFSDLPLPLAV